MNFINRSFGRPGQPRHPWLYFAGRMTMCDQCDDLDWRHQIVGYDALPDGMEHPVTPGTIVEFASLGFSYCGPYLHDGTGGHAVGHGADFDGDHARIFAADKVQIERCDLFLAYLDDLKAFGSLIEIGFAHALGKPIILGFGNDLSEHEIADLWFAQLCASQVYFGTPAQFWAQVKADWLGGRP